MPRIDAFAVAVFDRVEHEQPAAVFARRVLDFLHQRRGETRFACAAMDKQLLHVAAMRLIGRRVEAQLHRALDTPVDLRRKQNGFPVRDFAGHAVEVLLRFTLAERRHEAHGGAAVYAIGQHAGQFADRGFRSGRIQFDDLARPRHAYFPVLRLRMASVRRRSALSLMKPCASFWS